MLMGARWFLAPINYPKLSAYLGLINVNKKSQL